MTISKITGQELVTNFKFANGSVSTQNNTVDDGNGNLITLGGVTMGWDSYLISGGAATASEDYWSKSMIFQSSAWNGSFAVQNAMHIQGTNTGGFYVSSNGSGINKAIFQVDNNGNPSVSGRFLAFNGINATGNYGLPVVVANVSGYLITTTAATTVTSYTPTATGNFWINTFIRVITATTTVTLTVTYYDQGGTQQTVTILNGASQTVGNYSSVMIYITAGVFGPITVTATAGTASQVYASATIFAL